jgi:hypothetical protein
MIFVKGNLIAMLYGILNKTLIRLDGIKHERKIVLSCPRDRRKFSKSIKWKFFAFGNFKLT